MSSHPGRSTRALDKLGVQLAPLFTQSDLDAAKATLVAGLTSTRRQRGARLPGGGYAYEDVPDQPTRVVCAVKIIEWGIGKPVSTSLHLSAPGESVEDDPERLLRSVREDPKMLASAIDVLKEIQKALPVEVSVRQLPPEDPPKAPESQSEGPSR